MEKIMCGCCDEQIGPLQNSMVCDVCLNDFCLDCAVKSKNKIAQEYIRLHRLEPVYEVYDENDSICVFCEYDIPFYVGDKFRY